MSSGTSEDAVVGGPVPSEPRRSGLTLHSDELSDVDSSIPDVIGLHAWQPEAAVVKVMSIPNNHCVWVVILDENVCRNGFHEILIHDVADGDAPYVALAELSSLRLDWLLAVLSKMIRHQLDLEQLRHDCKMRYQHAQSGLCPSCGKFIRLDMGRHVASYHLELAQLWRCPVSWCTIWRGSPQDCIDHM